MRSILCLFVILMYCSMFTIYLVDMKNPSMDINQLKVFYTAITLGMLIFFFADLKTGFESTWHRDFNTICILSVIINMALILLIRLQVLDDSLTEIIIFNGSVFVVSLGILISGARHGEFKS